jgi:hypothetical protein
MAAGNPDIQSVMAPVKFQPLEAAIEPELDFVHMNAGILWTKS